MKELEARASASTKKTLMRHGAPEPIYGVRIGDMKPLLKRIKGDQDLALQLYATGVSDAMYLAGLVADGGKMTLAQLDRWAREATWHMISGCTVPWVAAEHPDAVAIATKWMDSPKESIAEAGWSTMSSVVATVPDEKLPIPQLAALLERVVKTIGTSANRVRHAMNSFVICCGTYVGPLADQAMDAARRMGKVDVDVGDTACQVQDAVSYIVKCRRGAAVAPKRKTTKC